MTNDIKIIPAYLYWDEDKRASGPGIRLYAIEKFVSMKRKLVERVIADDEDGFGVGERYLVIRVGDRFVSNDDVEAMAELVKNALEMRQAFKDLGTAMQEALDRANPHE